MENSLQLIIEKSGLEQSKANYMLENFQSYFKIAEEWEKKSKTLLVTDESDTVTMKMAKEGRLFMASKRVEVEKARIKMKEQSLMEGRAIDGIANVLKSLIVPIEGYLRDQEQFAERKRAERYSALLAERTGLLIPFGTNTDHYNLGGMDQETFDKLLEVEKNKYERRIEAEQKAERERIEMERAEAAERKRIRDENERLKKEAAEREKQIAIERKKAEMAAKAEREKQENEKAILEEKANEERKLREQAEAKIKADKAAQEKIRIDQEAKIKAAQEKAAAAPDREKLIKFTQMIKAMAEMDLGLSTTDGKGLEKSAKEKLMVAYHFLTFETNLK